MAKTGSNSFQFKQFTIHQDKTAMKVGTDGVVLGALAPVAKTTNAVLDIGTGTGLVALMLGQRTADACTIDAVEIDSAAYTQAKENVKISPFCNRIKVSHSRIQAFRPPKTYDLIVCNPPYFKENDRMPTSSRKSARQRDLLTFSDLVSSINALLGKKGKACLILPKSVVHEFEQVAQQEGLYVNERTQIRGNPHVEPKRELLILSKELRPPKSSVLTLELERHKYTTAFRELVKDFYLHL